MPDQNTQLLQRFEKDSQWFNNNINFLREEGFTGKTVAIKGGKVISSGENMDSVIRAVEKQKEQPQFIFIEIVHPEGYTLLF